MWTMKSFTQLLSNIRKFMKTTVISSGRERRVTSENLYVNREAQEIGGTTLAAIAGLGATLAAGGDYLIEALVPFTVESNGAAFGIEVYASGIAMDMWAVDASGTLLRTVITSLPAQQINGGLQGVSCLHVTGVILGATGGEFRLKAAQEDEDLEAPLVVAAGGFLRVTKLN